MQRQWGQGGITSRKEEEPKPHKLYQKKKRQKTSEAGVWCVCGRAGGGCLRLKHGDFSFKHT
jgi:hypothetical protein